MASMTSKELKEVEERPTYCRCWEPYVMITAEERDKLVELAKEALAARKAKDDQIEIDLYC